MIPLSNKELSFLFLVVANAGLIAWLLFYAFAAGAALTSFALLGAVLSVVLLRRSGESLLRFAIISASGALGLLLGCTLEFGRVALFSLSALCQTISEYGGIDAAWRMFLLSPIVHLGMWVGCSAALLILRPVHSLGHIYCILGMVLGMVISAAFPVSVIALPTEYFVISSVFWAWLWMCLGMSLPHWWCASLRA